MPYDIRWMLEGRIVFMRDYGVCTIEQLNDAVHRLNALLDSGTSPVHIIHDNRQVEKYPVSLKAIKPLVHKHPKTGLIAFLPADQASAFVVTVLTKLVGQPYKRCENIEDAIILLQNLDPSLPNDIPLPIES